MITVATTVVGEVFLWIVCRLTWGYNWIHFYLHIHGRTTNELNTPNSTMFAFLKQSHFLHRSDSNVYRISEFSQFSRTHKMPWKSLISNSCPLYVWSGRSEMSLGRNLMAMFVCTALASLPSRHLTPVFPFTCHDDNFFLRCKYKFQQWCFFFTWLLCLVFFLFALFSVVALLLSRSLLFSILLMRLCLFTQSQTQAVD